MKNLKVGDVVQLKSGSFYMTVSAYSNGNVTCRWQDALGKPWEETFPIDMLQYPPKELFEDFP